MQRARASFLLSTLAVSAFLVADAAQAGNPTKRGTLPIGSVPIGPSTNPNPTPSIGWPHDAHSATATACRAPGAAEVILTLYNGQCASLVPGFYVTGNDTDFTWLVTSIKVGSGVRARAFRWEHFSQNNDRPFTMYNAGTTLSLSGEAQSIGSMRVEPADRSMVCNDVREGEIALFEGWDGAGDCVVLPVGQYPSADSMGIANDSISGLNNQTSVRAILFWNAAFNKQGYVANPHQRVARLPEGGRFSDSIDNQTSSMQMIP